MSGQYLSGTVRDFCWHYCDVYYPSVSFPVGTIKERYTKRTERNPGDIALSSNFRVFMTAALQCNVSKVNSFQQNVYSE